MEYKHLTQKELDAIHDIWDDEYDVLGHIYSMQGMMHHLFLMPLTLGLDACKTMNPDEVMAGAVQKRKEIDEHHYVFDGAVMQCIVNYVTLKYLAVIDFDPFKFLELCQVDDEAKEM